MTAYIMTKTSLPFNIYLLIFIRKYILKLKIEKELTSSIFVILRKFL